jgi:hypothetical protein
MTLRIAPELGTHLADGACWAQLRFGAYLKTAGFDFLALLFPFGGPTGIRTQNQRIMSPLL